MDSITKLRGKLAEAENILQYVSKELESYSEKDSEERLNFAELKLRGEQYSFYEHPLKGQLFQDDYLALMIYLISLGGKKEEGWTVLYRIAAGCDYQGELQNLATDAMTFTEERLSDLIREIYLAELANIFAMDSLMISHHMGADDAQLKFLAGVYELLKLDKAFLTEAMEFVKVLDATFWDNLVNKCKAWKFISAKDMATYIGGYPAASLEEAAKLDYKGIVISDNTYTSKDVLNLDNWKANKILFLNCRFENCAGIYSAKKVVKFLSCSFNGHVERRVFHKNFSYDSPETIENYLWTNYQYNNYKEVYHLENTSFVNCHFKHFHDATAYFYLGQGLISDCTFEDIQQYPAYCFLFTINNATVSNTQFISCRNSMASFGNVKYDSQHKIPDFFSSCLIYSQNTVWKANKFNSCFNKFFVHDYDAYSYLLLLDKQSHCNNCTFENVDAYLRRSVSEHVNSKYVAGWIEKDYAQPIIGLHDSTADNNEGATTTSVGRIIFERAR